MQPVIYSVVKGIGGRGIERAGGEYMDKIFKFHPILKAISRLLIILIMNLQSWS